ncbi:ribonuclease H-like domain-containing protein [Sphingomonas sp. KRR8]|uniref:ribonuclease H-like domain-containing protein n=1 Tax=Sphingomonas sp. KRR8 TaxID=2942996 RepID=UPI0020215DBA|nr:ribonuclease H-like domain-containing protein [Sphingomonas sp. KRR8]URD59927.1 ribonuclease H-like domain-containing protein [Sphingomonas sp. KRR8]
MKKTVSIDVETVLDEEAAGHCGFVPGDEFAPWPVHRIVCASAFSVTRSAHDEQYYALESFSRGAMSERGIVMALAAAVDDANVVVTFNGYRFDLPVLLARAMVHEVHVPRLIDLQNRSRVGRHVDLFDQLKRDAAPVSLAHLCAPFAIPVKQDASASVAELAAREDWLALEEYCETDVVGCWLASLFWTKVQEPGFARAEWRSFAAWAAENATEHPSLAAFTTVPRPPRQSYPARGLDDFDF